MTQRGWLRPLDVCAAMSLCREWKHGLGDCAEPITDADQELSFTNTVGEGARENLGNSCRHLADTLDQADGHCTGTERGYRNTGSRL